MRLVLVEHETSGQVDGLSLPIHTWQPAGSCHSNAWAGFGVGEFGQFAGRCVKHEAQSRRSDPTVTMTARAVRQAEQRFSEAGVI